MYQVTKGRGNKPFSGGIIPAVHNILTICGVN